MAELTSSGTFTIADAAEAVEEITITVLPSAPLEMGRGRLIHPLLGAYDYEHKPDEWVNIDADAIIAPLWSSQRTIGGAANTLWDGYLKDVVVEERWKPLGGLSMPATQLRMLLMLWGTPVDPAVDYVRWYPNYISPLGFKVLLVNLQVGGSGVVSDDVINAKTAAGDPDGWITQPVTLTLKLVERL